MQTSKKVNRIVFISLAVVSILFLIFAPFYEILGRTAFVKDAFKSLFEGNASVTALNVVLPLAMTVSSLILLITAITGSKKAFITASIISIFLFWSVIFIVYFANDVSRLLDLGDFFDMCLNFYAWGTWLQFALYIVCLIVGIVMPKRRSNNFAYMGNGFYPNANQPYNYGQPQFGQPQYGQPQYGQPQYGQPQYGQPQYGQPQYGQPQFGQQQPIQQQPIQQPEQQQNEQQQNEQQQNEQQQNDQQQNDQQLVNDTPVSQDDTAASANNSDNATQESVCNVCGAPYKQGDMFCSNCGNKIA